MNTDKAKSGIVRVHKSVIKNKFDFYATFKFVFGEKSPPIFY